MCIYTKVFLILCKVQVEAKKCISFFIRQIFHTKSHYYKPAGLGFKFQGKLASGISTRASCSLSIACIIGSKLNFFGYETHSLE